MEEIEVTSVKSEGSVAPKLLVRMSSTRLKASATQDPESPQAGNVPESLLVGITGPSLDSMCLPAK